MNDCTHCDPRSFALKQTLTASNNFFIVCDAHPLIEGHILIIPKQHIACAGAFSQSLFEEFLSYYQRLSAFIKDSYGAVSSFEHGITGQTVFHAHVHILPYNGKPTNIVSEGMNHLRDIPIDQVIKIFTKEGKYLFFSLEDKSWFVDSILGRPRFFRDRFARAIGVPERGDWKSMHENVMLMQKASKENNSVQAKWKQWIKA